MLVGQHLGLDVPRVVEVALDEALTATEGGDCLAHGGVIELGDLLECARNLEAATATAEGGLDRDGQAVLLRKGDDLIGTGHGVGSARHLRRARSCGDVARGHLVAEGSDGSGGRADPGEPGVDDRLGEVGVLGQEAVARMHRVGAGALGRVDDLVDDQVAFGGG